MPVWAGQLGRSGQCAQPSLIRAMNCGPAVASAASRMPVAPLFARFGCQRVLLAFGGACRTRLAQVHQPPAAGFVTVSHQALGHRELVGRQLGVPLRIVLADRCLAGLDVDDHQPAGGVAFDPVDPASQPHTVAAPAVEDTVDVDLDADLGQLAAGLRPPGQERLDHRPMPGQLVGRIPLRFERQLLPGPLQGGQQLSLAAGRLGDQRMQHRTDRRPQIARDRSRRAARPASAAGSRSTSAGSTGSA